MATTLFKFSIKQRLEQIKKERHALYCNGLTRQETGSMINGGLWDFFIAGIENSVWEVDGLFFQFSFKGKELVIRHSISPNFLGHLSLNFSLKSMLNCSSLFCTQGRFGVLKEIVVSDKCSSTAMRIYKGSILNYTHAAALRSINPWRNVVENVSNVLTLFSVIFKQQMCQSFRLTHLWMRNEGSQPLLQSKEFMTKQDLPQAVSFDFFEA